MDWFLYDRDLRHERIKPPTRAHRNIPEKLDVESVVCKAVYQLNFENRKP